MRRKWVAIVTLSLGCSAEPPKPRTPPPIYAYGVSEFKDDATTNTTLAPDQLPLQFLDRDGKTVDLAGFRDKKNVVLIIMRGFPGYVCPNCAAQTSRLIRNHGEFDRRDAVLFVVYPGPKEYISLFVKEARAQAGNAELPFTLLIDPDYAAVLKLGIRADEAKPSTYILDKRGQVRFAYVGSSTADRPSLKAMLAQLDTINEPR